MSAKKDIIKSIVVLTVICLVISAALAVVNHFTEPVSSDNRLKREIAARKEIIPEAEEFLDLAVELPDGVDCVFVAKDAADNTLGYVVNAKDTGFGGLITVMCGIDTDGKIIAVKTMDVSAETSTLGGKTANPEYTDQYIGEDNALSGVSAISGATITSNAYKRCVEKAFAAFELVKEGN